MMEESFPAEKPVKSSERYDKSINLKHLKEENPPSLSVQSARLPSFGRAGTVLSKRE